MSLNGNRVGRPGVELDWNAITEAAARSLKGEPNTRLSNRSELRWGTRGSFMLAIGGKDIGRWRDWESGEGGRGVIRLVEYLLSTDRNGALDWLRNAGLLSGHSTAPSPSQRPGPANVGRPREDRASIARSIWSAGAPIPRDMEHPARAWFENRNLWRPELPTPTTLRWQKASKQHTGAGSIIALLATPEAWTAQWPNLPEPVAIQSICIDERGNPALDKPPDLGGLNKRTIGNAAGAVAVIGNPILAEAANPVRVAEGIADALAIAARHDAPVVAVTGTSGMRNPELAAWLATAPAGAVIHADADSSKKGRAPAGTTAAGFLRRAIAGAGGDCSALYPPEGFKDAAEAAEAAGFDHLSDDWIEYARTLAETTNWPRWEIARIAQIATSGA